MKPQPPTQTHVRPADRRVSRHPQVTWSVLTHRALDRIRLGAVTVAPDHTTLVLGLPVADETARAVASLLVADHAVMAGEYDPAGNTPLLLTPLGVGVWDRWEDEHPGGSL